MAGLATQPKAGRSRWTTRLLAQEVGLTSGCVLDLLRRHGLKPHLVRTYEVSRDPDFVAKLRELVGLYQDPPEHAVVPSIDEKTAIKALERTQPPLPLRAGRAVRSPRLQAPRRRRSLCGPGGAGSATDLRAIAARMILKEMRSGGCRW